MNIVQWAFPYTPSVGGREVFIERLSEGLVSSGDHVMLIAPAIGPTDPLVRVSTQSQLTTVRVNLRPREDLELQGTWNAAGEELRRLLVDFEAQVLHFHRPDGINVFLLKKLLADSALPAVFTAHGHFEADTPSKTERIRSVLSHCRAVVSISPGIHRQLKPLLEGKEVNLRLIVNGVPDRPRSSGHREGPDVFAFGRFAEEKGFHVLIDALGDVSKNQRGLRAVIAGSGPQEDALRAQAHRLGLSHHIDFPGWLSQKEIQGMLDRARMVVIPSIWEEPFGLVVAEAMLAGAPIIATSSGFLAEAIGHSETGFLVPPGDSRALAERMDHLLNLSAGETKALSIRAHQEAAKRFSEQRWLREYRQLFHELATK